MNSKKKNIIIKHKTVYMHTYTYMNSQANSEPTLQSIYNVLFEIIKCYISATFRMTILWLSTLCRFSSYKT